jgi:hypothetical protein
VSDSVNHPKHYEHPSGAECIEIAEWFPFNLGNAIKYIWRAGTKGDRLEDLRKARWYVDREITRLESAEYKGPELTAEEWAEIKRQDEVEARKENRRRSNRGEAVQDPIVTAWGKIQ